MIFEFLVIFNCVRAWVCRRYMRDDGCGNDMTGFFRLDDYFGLAPRVLLPLAPDSRLSYCAGQRMKKI